QLYPRAIPELPSLRLIGMCDPARMVSGDYYDYQQLGPDRVAIAIGDVAGKGISAALLMATVQSSFRTQLRGSIEMAAAAGDAISKATVSTSSVVSHLNQQLFADTSPEKFATFFLGVYDEPSGALTYTNAGHLPPILIHRGEALKLEVNGMVVGAFPFAQYGESSVVLTGGDLLVFYTDGITEPENEYGEMFGEQRLIDLVQKNSHLDDSEIISILTQAVRQWTGSDELQDDMTLLLARRR
ncbi:MAG TPA: PP2C family protein-serine/threonine phosphatase, partial [Thermoanaerobaculia bacterium]|nr:PP2C family protein-serine/threonine phosphatase [Thermoanaerobaculia bacterium]